MTNSPNDREFMARALDLGRQGRFWSSPNPSVGCVLVRDEQIIGRGFTQPAGGNHAEVEALQEAGDARGATAYVTLEPCSHFGRTPPCADALIRAGVGRVVVAIEDPNPHVAGQGVARLREAGIDVLVGVEADAAARDLRGFLLRMRRGWGRVRLKLACSLDGRTAMASGESQWITGPAARADVQRLRAESCVILTGAGTVLADDCALTVRPEALALDSTLDEHECARALVRKPLRAVLDSQCRLDPSATVFNAAAPSLVFHAMDASPTWRAETPNEAGVETLAVPSGYRADGESGLDLRAVLSQLGERGANEILIEAGPTVAAACLAQGLVDELVIYQAPKILGSSARALVNWSIERLADGVQLDYTEISRLGVDLRIIAVPRPQE